MIAGRLDWTRGRFRSGYTKEVMRVSQAVGLGVGLRALRDRWEQQRGAGNRGDQGDAGEKGKAWRVQG